SVALRGSAAIENIEEFREFVLPKFSGCIDEQLRVLADGRSGCRVERTARDRARVGIVDLCSILPCGPAFPKNKVTRAPRGSCMRQPIVRVVAAALIAFVCHVGTPPARATTLPFTAGAGQGVFLHVSDIHFDPFADPALVPRLIAAPVDEWQAIF